MTYHFPDWFAMAKQLQGSINIFSNDGPDMRWGGNEIGVANETSWSMINRTSPLLTGPSLWSYTSTGDPRGTDWVPPELDVSIRQGWFWHESQHPKSAMQLLDIYYTTVGRNGVLLLNVPPNSTGLVSDTDIDNLKKFRQAVDKIFGKNIASGSNATASSERGGKYDNFTAKNVLDGNPETYWTPEEDQGTGGYWIELQGLNPTEKFNVVRIEEAIQLGQRIRRHEVFVDGRAVVKNGTTVGNKRLHRLGRAVGARTVRIRVLDSRGPPLLSEVGLHFDPFKM
ncbi:hypothetical protein HPP92_006661 [Vanilla planifolia]|uniref:alpha-L-fucosidase n=1 Tax=Vanilla planifolia TaxID=51239 RepID=A0A835RPA6_VANPL|nr:hypothetical protein HPP92_006661 [Vanilla planifolia]